MEVKKIKMRLNVKCKALKWWDLASSSEIFSNCKLDLLQNDKQKKF